MIHHLSVGTHGIHIAFDAGSRAMVDAFHRVALAHGGSDAGVARRRRRTPI